MTNPITPFVFLNWLPLNSKWLVDKGIFWTGNSSLLLFKIETLPWKAYNCRLGFSTWKQEFLEWSVRWSRAWVVGSPLGGLLAGTVFVDEPWTPLEFDIFNCNFCTSVGLLIFTVFWFVSSWFWMGKKRGIKRKLFQLLYC